MIFVPLLAPFEASVIFRGNLGAGKNQLKPKTTLQCPSLTKLILPKYEQFFGTN